jgi:hypothetical protein
MVVGRVTAFVSLRGLYVGISTARSRFNLLGKKILSLGYGPGVAASDAFRAFFFSKETQSLLRDNL